MPSENIICRQCSKHITTKSDANFLFSIGFKICAFCNNCYSSKERSFWRHYGYFPRQPINSKYYLSRIVVIAISFSIILLLILSSFTIGNSLLGFVLFLMLGIVSIGLPLLLYVKVQKKLSYLHE